MSRGLRAGVLNNQLLEAIEPAARRGIDANLERVTFELGAVLCEADSVLEHAYFPQGNVLSLLTMLGDGSCIETASIGREGEFGLLAAMYGRTSFNRCMVGLEGPMMRCPIEVLRYEFERSEQMRNLFINYSAALLSQVQQSVACNAVHTTEERLCRWLLTMLDRAGGEPLAYTPEFLANILGAKRESVMACAQPMQAAGLIAHRAGTIQVQERVGLESASCECYAVVKRQFEALLSPPPSAVHDH
jgi:CRP-like cAMP-binding protein